MPCLTTFCTSHRVANQDFMYLGKYGNLRIAQVMSTNDYLQG
jgi:hypothetical protein